jgi:cobalt-zinc-cadmium efflux system outer membrane protein
MTSRLLRLVVALALPFSAGSFVAAQQVPTAASREELPAPRGERRQQLHRLPSVEEPQRLTLASVEQLALRYHPSLARAAAEVRAERGSWLQEGLYPNPMLSLGEQQTGSRGIAEQDGVAVQQEFVTANKLRLNREVASRRVAWTQQQFEAQRQRVLTDVRSEFFNVAIGERQRQVTTELVTIANHGVELAEERNKGTPQGRNDVLEAKIELYRVQVNEVQAVNRAQMARQRLAAAVGIPEIASCELDVNLNDLPPEREFDETLNQITAASPEIAAARVEIERAQWTLKRAGVEKIPNVTAYGLYNWRDNGVLGGKPDGAFVFSLPLPLFDRNQGGVQRALAELAAAERSLAEMEFSLRDRLADSFEDYANARFQARIYRDQLLPAAAQALELTRAAYQAGDTDYNDLLTSQRTNATANLEYLQALKRLRTSEMVIQGLLLSGSLDNTTK